MHYLGALLIAFFFSSEAIYAQSELLESVKKNPNEAIALCEKFKTLNAKGISSSSKNVINEISTSRNISLTDAEILSIYVIGMHCPEVN